MEVLHSIRRLGTAPLHHKCDDALSRDATIFELNDGPNAGKFVFVGTPMSAEEIQELHVQARAMEDIGGVADHESVVAIRDLGKAACQIFPITQAELIAIQPITPQSRAPHSVPWPL
jgi:hypothetical protein